jgi:hypothetical protein
MKKMVLALVIMISNWAIGYAQVGINSDNSPPDSSAMLDVKSTTKGMLPPRMTISQRNSIQSPAEGLIVYCVNCGANGNGELSVYRNGFWQVLSTQTGWNCGDPFTVNHITGNVAPVSKSVTYGTVTNIPGEPSKCWITRNLGASQQAISATDSTEQSAGWYWQFNRKQGYKHDGVTRTPNSTWITSIPENSDWIAENDPCKIEFGTVWRVPTSDEWYNVDNVGGWNNSYDSWNSNLKLHSAGFLHYQGGWLFERGIWSCYWSAHQYSFLSAGWGLVLSNTSSYIMQYPKTNGFSVRCIREL